MNSYLLHVQNTIRKGKLQTFCGYDIILNDEDKDDKKMKNIFRYTDAIPEEILKHH